jgi:hypothetical protein
MKKYVLIVAAIFFCTTSVQAKLVMLVNQLKSRIYINNQFADPSSVVGVAWKRECRISDKEQRDWFTIPAQALQDEVINYIALDPATKDQIYIYYITHDGRKGAEVRHEVYRPAAEPDEMRSLDTASQATPLEHHDDEHTVSSEAEETLSTAEEAHEDK